MRKLGLEIGKSGAWGGIGGVQSQGAPRLGKIKGKRQNPSALGRRMDKGPGSPREQNGECKAGKAQGLG